jgi:hypothetical protein
MNRTFPPAFQHEPSPFAILLGTKKKLPPSRFFTCAGDGRPCLPMTPVAHHSPRHGFHEVLFEDRARVEEICREGADTSREIVEGVGIRLAPRSCRRPRAEGSGHAEPA